jgi:hypothetical protein
MGELISARADVGRIEDHVRRALRAARARGGDVAEAAEERLAPAVAAIDGALALLTPAREAEAVAWAAVLAEDAKSDTGIKSLRDAMWNALGRPRQSPVMDLVFSRWRHDVHAGQPHAATHVDEGPALAADVGLRAAMDQGPVRRLDCPDRTGRPASSERGPLSS